MISNRSINYTLAALIVALVASSTIVATEEVISAHPHQKSIVDLSKDFVEDTAAMATSPGAAKIVEIASSDPLMRAAVVLENGKVVAKYHRDDVDENTPNQVWSTTKSWMSMLIGILVDKAFFLLMRRSAISSQTIAYGLMSTMAQLTFVNL